MNSAMPLTTPDYTQYKVENSPYADWYAALEHT